MKHINVRILALLGLALLQAHAIADTMSFDAPNEVTGRVIGPVISGRSEDGTQIKSYHLKLSRAMSLNDSTSSCGNQRVDSLPVLAQGIGRYRFRKVRVSASIQCVESRLGGYAITQIHSVKAAN